MCFFVPIFSSTVIEVPLVKSICQMANDPHKERMTFGGMWAEGEAVGVSRGEVGQAELGRYCWFVLNQSLQEVHR